MKFLFNMMNHGLLGQRSLEDVIGIVGHQLRALGHEAVWRPENDRLFGPGEGVNVIVEGFTPDITAVVADMHRQGARFICLATEEPTPKGFNWGTTKEMAQRQIDFVQAAPYLDGILHLVPGQHVTDWYSQFAPTAYVELGFAPSLIRGDERYVPEYEFGFFGSLSPRRHSILKRLANKVGGPNAIILVADFATQRDRDAQMRKAKVLVQIRKFEKMGLVSSSRCNTALHIGRPVIAEPHELSKPWDEIVHFSESLDQFYRDALAMRGIWKGVHATQMRKFRERLTPEFCIGQPLEKIGILERMAA